MRVMISGFAGFIGRHFAKRLHADGHEIVGVDNFCGAHYPKPWWHDFLKHDAPLQHRFYNEDIRSYIKRHKPSEFDLVIHCAAIVGGRLKIDGDPLAVATDLSIDAEIFNWLTRPTVGKMPQLIYFSSSAVYPLELQVQNCHCDLSESLTSFDTMRIGRPDQTYGWSKLSGEYLAKLAAEQYGLDVKVFRPFGGYGEDQGFDYPFPSIIRRILMQEDPITVWGSGDQERDFIHVDDIVDAVLETKDKLKPGEVLNLGTGRGVSFRNLAAMAHTILVPPSFGCNIVNDKTKPEGVFRRVADISKMEKFYTPKISLEQGIFDVGKALEKALDARLEPV
jgi:nucleoside-diphosphate-sugar epimerase